MKQYQTTAEEVGPEAQEGGSQRRQPYEAPRLVPFGHVKELTAGGKPGTSDVTLAASIV